MTPAVAPGAEVRRAAAAIRRYRCWDLGDAHVEEGCFDDHFRGELHSGRLEIHPESSVFSETPKAAVEVATWIRKQHATDRRQYGIPEIAVEKRHRAGLDAAFESVAHHQVVAVAEFVDERHQTGEVIAVVGITYNDEGAGRSSDTAQKGASVTPSLGVDDACPETLGDLHRPVGTAVVGDDDLAGDAVVTNGTRRLFDASRERFCFVETGHYNRKLWLPLLFVGHGALF